MRPALRRGGWACAVLRPGRAQHGRGRGDRRRRHRIRERAAGVCGALAAAHQPVRLRGRVPLADSVHAMVCIWHSRIAVLLLEGVFNWQCHLGMQ